MDDNILYYIILGAIYVLSRVLKKKKPAENNAPTQQNSDDDYFKEEQPKKTVTFEDLFKELTGEEFTQPKEKKAESVLQPEPVIQKEIKPEPSPATRSVEEELIDIVPHKPIERDKPIYERSTNFKVNNEEESLADDIFTSLQDEDEIKKAIIYKEIFDRKY